MKGYHEGRKMNKVLMSAVSMLLCIMMVAMSTMTAFAGTADNGDGTIKYVFNSVDDIANDEICLIVFDDMYQSGADSEGRALIGGNLTVDGGWSPGKNTDSTDKYILGVGGSISGSINAKGCVAVGGDTSNAYIEADCHHGLDGNVHKDTTGWVRAYVKAAEATFQSASKQYAQMPADGTSERNQYNNAQAVLTASENHKSGEPHVFYIDSSQYLQEVKFVGDFGNDPIIINVSGSSVEIYGGQWEFFQDCDLTTADLQNRAIWNFYEATSLVSMSFSFQGSLLAPFATYYGNNGHVNGTTVVKNMNGTGGFEYHTGHFFKNPLKAGLTVSKSMSDGSTSSEQFGFELFQYNSRNKSWTSIQTFSLRAGESKSFSDLVEGQTYKVKETNSGSSRLISINSNASADINDCSASFTVNSASYNVNFVNEPATGSITVSKKLIDSINPNAKFSFTLQKYENGNWQNVTGATNFYLGNGESKTFSGLAYGTYRVVEDADTSIYDVSISGDGSSVSSAETSKPAASVKITDTSLTPKDSSFAELTKGFRTLASDAVIDYIYVSSDGVYSFCLDFNKWSPAGTGTQYALNSNFKQQYVGVMQGTHAFTVAEARILVANFLYPTIDHEYPNVGEVTKYHVAEWMLWGNLASAYTGFSDEAQRYANWLFTTPSLGIVVEPSDNFTLGGYANNGTTQSVNVVLKENVSNVDAVKFNNLPSDAVIYDANGKAVTLKTSATGTKYFRNPTSDTYKVVLPASYDSSVFSNIYVGLDVYSNRANEYVVYTATEYTDSFQPMLVTSKILNGKWKAITITNNITENNPEVTLSSAMQNAELTFTNTRKNAVLTVSKTIKSGDPATDESFTFQLYSSYDGVNYQKSGDTFTLKANTSTELTLPAGVYYKVEEVSTGTGYTLDSSSDTNIFLKGNATATFTNAVVRDGSITVYKKVENGGNSTDTFTFKISGPDLNETFTLTAGQSQTFSGLRPGDVYTITETGMDGKYEFVSVEGGQANGKSVAVTVSKGAAVTFTNKVKLGSITVTKTLNDTLNPNATFNFVIKDSAGNQVGTLSVGNGKSATLTNLPYGGVYTVTESVDTNSYSTTYSVDSANAAKGTTAGPIVISGAHTVAFTNTRASAKINVTKALAAGSVDLGETFTFQLYKRVNNKWTAQGSSFSLKAGETQSIAADVGAEYAVVETSTGASYEFSTVSGGSKSVSIGGASGTSFTVTGETNITFTNKLRTGSVYVYKKLNDSIFTDSSFTFTLQKMVSGNWKDVEIISIKNNQGYEFKNLEYGYNYRVVETVDANAYTTSYVVNDASVVNGRLTTGKAVANGVTATTSAFKLDAAVKAVTFTNTRNTASLTVKKALTADSNNLGESFTFALERYVNGAWENTGKTATILAGASYTFSGLEVGLMYRVTETSTGASYTYEGIAGADSAVENGGIITLNRNAEVTITNAIKTGKIVISKTVSDNTDPNAKFTFSVYQKVEDKWVQYGQSFQLGNGQTKEFSGLPYGATFKVVEYDNTNYTTSYKLAADTFKSNETEEIVINSGSVNVDYVNTRKTASVKVVKALTAGSADFGETFNFVLQRYDGSKWVDVESFELQNNGSKTFDLAVGANYRVLETKSGTSYKFNNVTGGTYVMAKYDKATVEGASFTVSESANSDITIYNAPKSASIVLRKSVIGTDTGDTFTFDVQKYNGTSYVTVDTITLKAGGRTEINALLGEKFRIVEKSLGTKYELTAVNGADENDLKNMYAYVTVDGSEDITFVNTVKKGSIAVTKTVVDTLDTEATFVFEAYRQADNEWIYVGSKALANGETWNISNLEYGTVVKIVETDANGARYETVNTAGGSAEVIVTVNGSETVGFTNTRKTASLKVSKAISAGAVNMGGSFTFELMVEKGGAWASVTGFNLEAGQSKTITGLYADATYMLVEKLGNGSMYVLDTYAGGTIIDYNGSKAVKFTAVADQNVEVTAYNKNSQTTLTIDKTVTGSYDGEAFDFVLEKKNASGTYEKVDTFSLTNGASKSFAVTYGEDYRVYEKINSNYYKLTGITGADSVNGSVALIKINNADEKISFTNERKTTSIVINKQLAAGANNVGGSFNFTVYEDKDGEWVFVKDVVLTVGATETVSGLDAGKSYLVVEKLAADSKYKFDSATGGEKAVFEGCDGIIIKAADVTPNKVTFTNTNASTTLTVKKTVNGIYSNEGFTFLLEKKNGETYEKVEEFTLAKDESKTFNVSFGDEYRITETATGANYSFTRITGADETDANAAFITIDNTDENVAFTNTRKIATLKIVKALAEGSNDLEETFTFVVTDEDGKEVKTVSIKAGETATISGLAAGRNYTVVEKLAANSGYSLLSVTGAEFNGSNGGAVTVSPDNDNVVTFTNQIKGASLTLNKVVTGIDNCTDSFTFEVKINGKAQNVTVVPGTPKTIKVNIGDTVVITETKMGNRYELANIVVDGTTVSGTKASLTIGKDGNSVTFTNNVKEASLTVTKGLAKGSTKLEGKFEFKFDVYHVAEDGTATKLANKSFTLNGIGDSYTVNGLLAGEKYMVVETESGEGYVCAENNKTIVLEPGKNGLTVENKNDTTTVEVEKIVDGIYRGEEFKFSWKNETTGEVGEFTLGGEGEDAEWVKVIDVHYGDTVVIDETDDGEYFELVGIEGTKNVDGTKATVEVTVGGQRIIYTDTNTLAKLTISKKLAAGSKDIGGEFKFNVYHVVDGVDKLVNETPIVLGINGNYEVKGLISGETYKVVETESGEGWSCVANNKTIAVEPDAANTVVIENQNASAVVTLVKHVDSKYAPEADETFEFEVYVNGEKLEENIMLAANEKYELAVNYGDVVKFTEVKLNGRYVLASITGADTVDGSTASVSVDQNSQTVTFTNAVKTGSITVHKTVEELDDSGKVFTFELYRRQTNEDGTSELVNTNKTVKIGNGGKGVFDNLEYGEYEVREVGDSDYVTYCKLADEDSYTQIDRIEKKVNGGNIDIDFLNKRGSVDITVSKDLLDGEDSTEEFNFLLQRYDSDSKKWIDVETIVIKGEGTSDPVRLDINKTYRILETKTGESFDYVRAYADAAISGASTDSDPILGSGIKFTSNASGNITFENTLKTTSLKVKKTVVGTANGEFTFVYSVNGGAKVEKTIEANKEFSINVKYGDVVEVYEKSSDNYTLVNINSNGVDLDESSWIKNGNTIGVKRTVGEAGETLTFTNQIKMGKLTVTKAVNDKYVVNDNSTFDFKVQKQVNGTSWEDMTGIFTLGNGQKQDIENIEYGTKVRVVEIIGNEEYYSVEYKIGDETAKDAEISSTGAATESITVDGEESVTIINTRNTAKLAITKKIADNAANLGDDFKVLVESRNGAGNWTKYKEVTLKAGETKTIDVGVGVKYRISESNDGANYEFVSINDDTSGYYTTSVDTENGCKTVTVTNRILTGSIKITKTLNDVVDPNASFEFTVTDDQGVVKGTATLTAGGSAEIKGLPYGSTYTVKETVSGKNYSTTYSVDSAEAVAAENKNNTVTTESITISGTHTVAFTNTRKTADLTVVKSLAEGSEDRGEEFKFALQIANGDKWDDVKTFTLKADEENNTIVLEDLYVNAQYRVIEISTGVHYAFDTVKGDGKLVETDLGSGAAVTIAPAGSKVEFVNAEHVGGIKVEKLIGAGSANEADEFNFTIEGYGFDESNNTFTLKANQSKVFSGLVAGYEYTITETDKMGEKYQFSAVSGDGAVKDQSIKVKVPDGNNVAKAVFTNDVKTASLTISKSVVDKAAVSGTKYTFVVTDAKDGSVVATVSIAAGETATVSGLFYGETYTVAETNVDTNAYTTTCKVNGGEATTGTAAKVTIAKDTNTAAFTNTRNESDLTITKTVNGFMSDNEEFYITVDGIFTDGEKTLNYVITKDGKPVVGSPYSNLEDVIYAAVDSKIAVEGTLYGQDYTVTEHGSTYYTVKIDGVTGASRVIEVKDEASVIVENIRNSNKITIDKVLSGNDKDYEDTFKFELQVKDGNNWTKIDEFELTVGETMEYTSDELASGRVYRVIETDSGANYMFAGVKCSGTYDAIDTDNAAIDLTLDSDKTVTFTNTPDTQGLVVYKKVTEVGKQGETFSFELYKGSKLYDTFNLKAGEMKQFDDLPLGDTYKIVETTGDAYKLAAVSVVNGKYDELKVNDALAGVQNLKLGTGEATKVTFENSPVVKNITISKAITGTDKGEKYTFQVMNGSEIIDTFTLANGESKTVEAYYGVEYKVVELQNSSFYQLINVEGADDFVLGDGSATVTVDGDENIEYTNEIRTGEIVLTKSVTGFGPAGDEFEFTLTYADGTPVKADGLKNGKVILKDGGKIIVSGIEYGKEVIVSEKINDTCYTASYTVNNIYGEGVKTSPITINAPSTKVDFFNKYEEPVNLNAYSNGDYRTNTSVQSSNRTIIEDETPVTTPPTTEPTGVPPTNGTNPPPTSGIVQPTNNNVYTVATTRTNVQTTPTTARQALVLGASDFNTVSGYNNTAISSHSDDSDQVITKVLGDSDTPDTGDSVPVSVVIALAVSSVMVLTLGKKKKTAF